MSCRGHQGRETRGRLILILMILFWGVLPFTGLPKARQAAAQDTQDVYKRVYTGWKWWHVYCYRCHGLDVLGSRTAPNLRESFKTLTYEQFLQIVREGRPKKGMMGWKRLLDDKQITDIYMYVNARSAGVLPPGRPDEVGSKGGPWAPPQGWQPTYNRR